MVVLAVVIDPLVFWRLPLNHLQRLKIGHLQQTQTHTNTHTHIHKIVNKQTKMFLQLTYQHVPSTTAIKTFTPPLITSLVNAIPLTIFAFCGTNSVTPITYTEKSKRDEMFVLKTSFANR
jgi:hypothetical protein